MKLRSGNLSVAVERPKKGRVEKKKKKEESEKTEEDRTLDRMVRYFMVKRSERGQLRQLIAQSR
jgi:hypothetical protein